MKKILFLFAMMSMGIASAQEITDAVEYNDYIVDLQNEIGYKMIDFNQQLEAEESTMETIKPYFEDLLSTTRDVIKRLERLGPWDNSTELKEASLDLFRFYELTIDRDYRRMMWILYESELTQDDYDELTQILEQVTEAEGVVDERFQTAQVAFAVDHGFTLDVNELQEELDGE